MRDFRRVFSNRMRDEFLDRFGELAGVGGSAGAGGLESIGGAVEGITRRVDEAARAIEAMNEGRVERLDGALEAIILRFGRPAYLIQNATFDTTNAPSSSEEIDGKVNGARALIEAAIPSVGRINLRNHRMSWVGTGWLVAPNVVVTNRHVAREFAEADGDGFAFVEDFDGRPAQARLDTVREHKIAKESVFRLKKVLWIEPSKPGKHDVAFLEIDSEGEEDQPLPAPVALMSEAEFAEVQPERWLGIIGYPAFSTYNDSQDQQRIFDGIFDVKRLQPGKVSTQSEGKLLHDATTLGGNSGSLVLDLDTGKAMALHFGGIEGEMNFAVTAPVVNALLTEHAGGG